MVHRFLKNDPATLLLDLGCGTGSLRTYLMQNGYRGTYAGVDRVEASAHMEHFIRADITDPDAPQVIMETLAKKPDVIVLLALLEHLKDPENILTPYTAIMKPNTIIIGTTPHPIGRSIHDLLAKIGICSRDAADEHESFLNHRKIEELARNLNLELICYKRFLWGLNQFFVFKQSDNS